MDNGQASSGVHYDIMDDPTSSLCHNGPAFFSFFIMDRHNGSRSFPTNHRNTPDRPWKQRECRTEAKIQQQTPVKTTANTSQNYHQQTIRMRTKYEINIKKTFSVSYFHLFFHLIFVDIISGTYSDATMSTTPKVTLSFHPYETT